jgi:glucose-1-phosphate thymidylyltransferase
MRGIVLAGGTGSRLWPITKSVCKQLLPVYDKPLIHYPISTLMLAGVREILIITTPEDRDAFKSLLGDGSDFGIKLEYAIQESPKGIAQAFMIGKDFLKNESCLFILGDNIFYGAGLGQNLRNALPKTGAHVFTYEVNNPGDYGVIEINDKGKPVSIEEKPHSPKSRLAVTGLYFFDERVTTVAETVKPSTRGELEITSVIDFYLKSNELSFTSLTRGTAWLDTGTPNALQDAASFVRIIEERTGTKIACLEEIAYQSGWISRDDLLGRAKQFSNSSYAKYLIQLAE